jgi:hypothetical protein
MLLAVKISLICSMFVFLGEDDMIFAPYQRLIRRLPLWLYKPLGGCSKCVTGQVALWYFIFKQPFDLLELLFFVSLSILITSIITKLWQTYEL